MAQGVRGIGGGRGKEEILVRGRQEAIGPSAVPNEKLGE